MRVRVRVGVKVRVRVKIGVRAKVSEARMPSRRWSSVSSSWLG